MTRDDRSKCYPFFFFFPCSLVFVLMHSVFLAEHRYGIAKFG